MVEITSSSFVRDMLVSDSCITKSFTLFSSLFISGFPNEKLFAVIPFASKSSIFAW